MTDCKTVVTPEGAGQATKRPPEQLDSSVNSHKISYRETVGAFQYLVTYTRLGITNVVRTVGKVSSCYTHQQFVMAKTCCDI
ncbi:hypothetical protein PybrP1_000547 [[Pythium] brassicae (nom. inval.)]|nr:hypothetical protein PybrP1_000547 [[Pythium] brassicae (nom. inval.)]